MQESPALGPEQSPPPYFFRAVTSRGLTRGRHRALANRECNARALSPRFRSEPVWQYPGEHGPGPFGDLRRWEPSEEEEHTPSSGREPNGSSHEVLVDQKTRGSEDHPAPSLST